MKYFQSLISLLCIVHLSAFTLKHRQISVRPAASTDRGRLISTQSASKQRTSLAGTTDRAIAGAPKIKSIKSRDDLLKFLAEDERLCVVKFYASWCKSCAKFGLKYKQLAKEHGCCIDESGRETSHGDVRFAQIEYGENIRLCKSFGIKKLPFVQIYKAECGKIDEFVCGPKDFNEKVTKRVEELLSASGSEFDKNMEDGQALSDALVASFNGNALGVSNSTRVSN